MNTKVVKKNATNATNNNPIRLNDKSLADVQEFLYLCSNMTTDGDCNKEVNGSTPESAKPTKPSQCSGHPEIHCP